MTSRNKVVSVIAGLRAAGVLILMLFVYFGPKQVGLDVADTVSLSANVELKKIEKINIDFEDDPQSASQILCDPSLELNYLNGVLVPYPLECDPAHHEWLKSKGVDVAGIRNGFLRTTMVGSSWATGIVLKDSPTDGSNPGFRFTFLNRTTNYFGAEVITTPSIEYSNIPATVVLQAFDSENNLLNYTTYEFTTVTNSTYTPAILRITTSDFNISAITLEVKENPTHEFWIESITFKRVATDPVPDTTPPAITVPLPWDWKRTDVFENERPAVYYGDDRSWLRAYDAIDGGIPLSHFKAHDPSSENATDQAVADGLGTFVCDPQSGSQFPVGKTLVTCIATDSSGNASTRSFIVGVGLCKVISEGTIECRAEWP